MRVYPKNVDKLIVAIFRAHVFFHKPWIDCWILKLDNGSWFFHVIQLKCNKYVFVIIYGSFMTVENKS